MAATQKTLLAGGAAALAVLLALNFASARQVRTWRDSITLWEQSVAIGPENGFARRALGDALAKAGQYEPAFGHFREALRVAPYSVQTPSQFAGHLATCDDRSLRDYELAIRLASLALQLGGRDDPETAHTLAVACNNFAVELGARGETARSIDLYRKAIESDPAYPAPCFNLALCLVAGSNPAFRDPQEAVRLAEHACRLPGEPTANEWMILAMAYAETGQADNAIATVETAAGAAEAAGDLSFAAVLRERLRRLSLQDAPFPP